ncbi:MAG TPA: PilN domain-containing protein [Tissierellaceae bacterium]|nr:PilN domain-containing protein [Tissierellaceae bacterium]
MKDLNFFDPYIEKGFKISKQFFFNIFVLLSILFLIGYSIFNQLKINKLESRVEEKRKIAEDPKIVKKVEEIKEQEDELKRFEEEVENIRQLNEYIDKTDVVNTSFLQTITSKIPEDMFLIRLNMSYQTVEISGISKDKLNVAQFKKGLEALEPIEDIFISHITREEDHYTFGMNIHLKEVDLGGEDESEVKESQDSEATD